MSLVRFAAFALVFAARDLFGGPARATTLVVVCCVAMAFAAIVALFGWVNGTDHGRRQRVVNNPLALCLVADSARLTGTRITPEQIACVERTVAGRSAAGVRVTPFEDLRFDCQLAPSADRTAGESGTIELTCRTVATADPLVQSIPLRPTAGRLPDRWFVREDEEGVVITSKFLQRLGYSADDPPTHVGLRSPVAGTLHSVPVLGLTDHPLPLDHLFVLSTGYEWRLRTTDPDVKAVRVKTGPLTPAQADDEVPVSERVKQFCLSRGWSLPANQWDVRDRRVWEIEASGGEGLPVSYWQAELVKLRRVLAAEGRDPGDAFTAPQLLEKGKPVEVPERIGAGYLAVYVSDAAHLSAVAGDLERCGLRVDREVVRKLEALDEQTRFALGTLRLTVIALLAVVAVAVFCLLKVRLAARMSELGLLKAMGLCGARLFFVYTVEGVMLGLIGVIIGGAVGLLVGWLLPGSWVVGWVFGDRSAVDGFLPDVGVCGWLAGIMVTTTSGSVLVSVARAISLPPLLTLNGGEG